MSTFIIFIMIIVVIGVLASAVDSAIESIKKSSDIIKKEFKKDDK